MKVQTLKDLSPHRSYLIKKKKKVCLLSYSVLGYSAARLEGFELATFQYRPLPLKSAPTESDLASAGSQQESPAQTPGDALGATVNPISGQSFNPRPPPPPAADAVTSWLGEPTAQGGSVPGQIGFHSVSVLWLTFARPCVWI